jgi:hypothetical protein
MFSFLTDIFLPNVPTVQVAASSLRFSNSFVFISKRAFRSFKIVSFRDLKVALLFGDPSV